MENENLVLIAKFCLHYEVEPSFITSLNDFGLITLLEVSNEHYLSVDEIKEVEKMVRLHFDLGINLEGIDAIASLLKQITNLQHALVIAQNRLLAFVPESGSDD
ncbi:MAG: chaperone modulator CbpM [Pedobacter sp.]